MRKIITKKLTYCFIVVLLGLFLSSLKPILAASGSLTQLGIITGESVGDSFGYPNNYSPIQVADVNEDGIDDMLIGARYHEPSGGLYIFLGKKNISGTDAINADIILRDDEDTDSGDSGFGETFSTGDIDGDSHLELLVGNYRHDVINHNEGAAYTFKLGSNFSSRGVSQSEARTVGLLYRQSLSAPARILGDLNGDNFDDYILTGLVNDYQYHIYYGSSQLSDKTINQDDVTISDVGNKCIYNYMIPKGADINKDGYTDLIIGCAYAGDNIEGAIYIFYGGPTLNDKDIINADIIINSATGLFIFGSNVSTGDINNDGYADIISNTQNKAYVFFGSSNWSSKSVSNADITYSSDPNFPSCDYTSYVEMSDINNDGLQDIILANSCSGKLYVIYGDVTLSDKDASQSDLIFDGPTNIRFGDPMTFGDINDDGYKDVVAGAGDYNSRQGRVYFLTPPHGSPLINLNNIGNTNNLTISGTVTDTLTVGGVEVSTDNGDWNTCTVSSGNFTCGLSSTLTDGSHSLRLRSKNSLGIYMATREYNSASFTYDQTSPLVDWTDTSGTKKKYESSGNDNVFTTDQLPTFIFTKSSDATAGLSKYQILVNDNLYIDSIDPTKPGDKDYREDDDKYVKYDGDNNILVHAKKDKDKLTSGKAYKWRVRAVDSAGNSTDTQEKIIRINTHEANFSGSWFPLTLLNIGGSDINFSSIAPDKISSSLNINSTTPTFYGIAPVGTKVTLKIEKENDSNSGRDLVFSTTSSANESSRFGINVTDKLIKQEYFVNLSAVNPQGDYVELPEFKLNVGGTGILQKIEEILKPNNIVPTSKPKTQKKVNISNKPPVKQKRCFLFICW